MSVFGDRMRVIRQRRGLSQTQLAKMVDMARQQINNYEKGRFEPGIETALKIADALHVSLDILTGRRKLPEETRRTPRLSQAVAAVGGRAAGAEQPGCGHRP